MLLKTKMSIFTFDQWSNLKAIYIFLFKAKYTFFDDILFVSSFLFLSLVQMCQISLHSNKILATFKKIFWWARQQISGHTFLPFPSPLPLSLFLFFLADNVHRGCDWVLQFLKQFSVSLSPWALGILGYFYTNDIVVWSFRLLE